MITSNVIINISCLSKNNKNININININVHYSIEMLIIN